MVIAIDGPAGAGKSTVARAVAERLGYTYLDSGAMYRCVALLVGERDGDPAALAEAATIELGDRVLLDGRDVSEAIRTPAISEAASQVSANIGVRMALVRKQQGLLRNGGDWVAEGRDIGTVVCPGADVKIYLNAERQIRAERRLAERPEIGADALATDLRLRDQSDAERMMPAADAVRIDTTELDVEDVVGRIEQLVRERQPA
jgi:CMP/dCMP kinase